MYTTLLNDDESVATRQLETNWPGVHIGKGKGKDRVVRALFLANTAAVAVASVYIVHFSNVGSFRRRVSALGGTWMERGLSELPAAVWQLVIASVLSTIFGALWIAVMNRYVRFVIKFSIGAGLAAIFSLGVYFVTVGYNSSTMSPVYSGLSIDAGALFIFFVYRGFFRNKVELTCDMFVLTGRALKAHSKDLFALTAMTISAVVSIIAVFTWLIVCQFSFSESYFLFWYLVFTAYWISSTLMAALKMTVAGTVSHWYFTSGIGGGTPIERPVFAMYKTALTNSLGSLALGSLVVSILATATWALQRTISVLNLSPSWRTNKALILVLRFLAWLLEKTRWAADLMNRYSYCYMAMHGLDFFESGKRVISLFSKHGVDVTSVEICSRFILFTYKSLFTCLVTLFSYGVLYAHTHRPVPGPIVLSVVSLSYSVLSVFSLPTDYGVVTMCVAYCEDMERNGRASGTMSREVAAIVQNASSKAGTALPPEVGTSLLEEDEVDLMESGHDNS